MLSTPENLEEAEGQRKPHYGYLIAMILFVSQVIVFIGSRSFSIALIDIQETLGVSVAQIGLIAAWYSGMANFGSIIWGGVGDRLGPRYSSIFAGCVFSAGCVLFGVFGAESYLLALFLWTLTAFGSSGLQETVVPKLVKAWFVPQRRGHAMRLISPGGPTASIILGVIVPIGLMNWGWGSTFVVLGIFTLALTGLFVLIRNAPQEKGLAPIGAPNGVQPAPKIRNSQQGKNLYLEAARLKITWHIGLIYILYQFYFITHTTYYVANLRTLGFNPQESGLLVTMAGFLSILAMQFWGPLSDRIGRKKALMIMLVGASVMPFAIFFVSQTQPSLYTMYAVCLVTQVFCSGAPVFMAILADYFPVRLNSTCNGIVSALSALGSFLAPWLGGLIIDGSGSMYYYCLPMAVGAALCLVFCARLPKPDPDA